MVQFYATCFTLCQYKSMFHDTKDLFESNQNTNPQINIL